MLLRESIERLAQLDVEWLLAGHGEVIQGKKNIQRNFAYIRSNYYDYLGGIYLWEWASRASWVCSSIR